MTQVTAGISSLPSGGTKLVYSDMRHTKTLLLLSLLDIFLEKALTQGA